MKFLIHNQILEITAVAELIDLVNKNPPETDNIVNQVLAQINVTNPALNNYRSVMYFLGALSQNL